MLKIVQSSKYIQSEHENVWKNFNYSYPSILKRGGGLCEVYHLHSAHKIFIKTQETIFTETNFIIIKSSPTRKLEIFDQISSGWLTTEFHKLLLIKPGTISSKFLEGCL